MGLPVDLDKPMSSLTPTEQRKVIDNLASTKSYGEPRKLWVEDGHVFVEGHDGEGVSMLPAVAIKMGRMLDEAGAADLINRVIKKGGANKMIRSRRLQKTYLPNSIL